MKVIRFLLHFLFVIILSITTQVGGLIWLISIAAARLLRLKNKFRPLVFLLVYICATFFIIPILAELGDRVPLPISKNGNLVAHNYMTVLLNRHYVKKRLDIELSQIADDFEELHPSSKVAYLDANFPFIDGFPLLPHRSHNDGRKVDLSFMYLSENKEVNSKPSRSGYGYYEYPKNKEYNQPKVCLDKGYWQYDFPKYITLGSSDQYSFDKIRTKDLILLILNESSTHKVFIEPHLKTRLGVDHPKCRYHGCKAVRHDDHIHYQIK